MPKNKEDQDDDTISRLGELVSLHNTLANSPVDSEGKHTDSLNSVIDKLEEHILNLLSQLDFSTTEEED